MNKENEVYIYNGITFSLKKEGNPAYVTTWKLEDIMLSDTSKS